MSQLSFLKWAGSKRSALSELFGYLPREGEVLVEPFVGSATVALNTDYDKYILNDNNVDLINLYKLVVSDPNKLYSLVMENFKEENNTKHAFVQLRDMYNQSSCTEQRAVLFLYLNRHCFNGLMRYNLSGIYNTSFGSYSKPAVSERDILVFAEKFKHARFVAGSFSELKFVRKEGVFVYLDPPYLPISKTASFTAYGSAGFNMHDHKALDKKASYWASGGCKVMLSNHDVPLLSDCYKKHKVKASFFVPRTISSKISDRNPVKEALLLY